MAMNNHPKPISHSLSSFRLFRVLYFTFICFFTTSPSGVSLSNLIDPVSVDIASCFTFTEFLFFLSFLKTPHIAYTPFLSSRSEQNQIDLTIIRLKRCETGKKHTHCNDAASANIDGTGAAVGAGVV
jgi:hypothetical protein